MSVLGLATVLYQAVRKKDFPPVAHKFCSILIYSVFNGIVLPSYIGNGGGCMARPVRRRRILDPAAGVYWQEPEEWWPAIREYIPAYDKRITPTNFLKAIPHQKIRPP